MSTLGLVEQSVRFGFADTEGVTAFDDVWTVADLARLPDDGNRYEIVDGRLVMSPSPAVWHQVATASLRRSVEVAMPPGFAALENVGVATSAEADRYLIPDLCVLRLSGRGVDDDRVAVDPADVRLVVEVVSPSSANLDRKVKPLLYAEAGIPSYWRAERGESGVSVTIYELVAGNYRPVCEVPPGETVAFDRPWPTVVHIDGSRPGSPPRNGGS
jgi:Uma2 family endonuclease